MSSYVAHGGGAYNRGFLTMYTSAIRQNMVVGGYGGARSTLPVAAPSRLRRVSSCPRIAAAQCHRAQLPPPPCRC